MNTETKIQLVDAAKQALDCLKNITDKGCECPSIIDGDAIPCFAHRTISKLRAAIAKATGTQPQ